MDILIKNMEMPVDHGVFIVICPSGTIEQKVGNADNGYPIYNIVKDAKAVALPSHGRLIDADELEGILDEVNGYGGASEITYKKMIEILHDEILAPVIVEASNGTDN